MHGIFHMYPSIACSCLFVLSRVLVSSPVLTKADKPLNSTRVTLLQRNCHFQAELVFFGEFILWNYSRTHNIPDPVSHCMKLTGRQEEPLSRLILAVTPTKLMPRKQSERDRLKRPPFEPWCRRHWHSSTSSQRSVFALVANHCTPFQVCLQTEDGLVSLPCSSNTCFVFLCQWL